MYSSWMLADGEPRACDASHTIQRAASTDAASSLKVAVHTTSRIPDSRNACSSSISSVSRSIRQMPER